MNKVKSFIPTNIFAKDNYAIMILNGELNLDALFFKKVWNKARFRHTVDGGSNNFVKMYHIFENTETPLLFPHVTSGDFDSIEPDVYQLLEKSSITKIVPTMNQDLTDFTKALHVLMDQIEQTNIKLESVIVFVENSGRLDQILANINTLHKSPLNPEMDLYILSSINLTWLMQPEVQNKITFESENTSVTIDKICGVIPTNGPTRMRSTGLKWELNNQVYHFGGLISTSNRVVQRNICLESDANPILFTVEMNQRDFLVS